NFKKAEDFYLALGGGKVTAKQVVDKVLQRLKTEEVAQEEAVPLKAPRARHAVGSENYGIVVHGVEDVLVRLAKGCTPVPGAEVGDVKALSSLLRTLRNVDGVFDAYRVTPN